MNKIIVDRLIELGVKEHNLEEIAIILSTSTVDEASRKMGQFHYGAGYSQVMLPMFRRIYPNQEIRNSILRDLESMPISSAIIDNYFMNMGNQPFLVLHCKHEDIPINVRKKFIDKCDELMLQYLKKDVGLS